MNHSKKHCILKKNKHAPFFLKNEEPDNYTYPNLWSVKPLYFIFDSYGFIETEKSVLTVFHI